MYSTTESFMDAAGNWIQPGDAYMDYSGQYRRPGETFMDCAGNWVQPGDSFMDYSGQYVRAGEPFMDRSGGWRRTGNQQVRQPKGFFESLFEPEPEENSFIDTVFDLLFS